VRCKEKGPCARCEHGSDHQGQWTVVSSGVAALSTASRSLYECSGRGDRTTTTHVHATGVDSDAPVTRLPSIHDPIEVLVKNVGVAVRGAIDLTRGSAVPPALYRRGQAPSYVAWVA
jgi:hypothetical protein